MDRATQNGRLIRFSIFELDRDSGELFKQGRKVKLQGQPFELLVALLERQGEVLTREELRQKIWPSEIAGDFDQGLNRAINKVREALGDSADTPRFIETVPRRGYRFIGSIEEPAQEAALVQDAPAEKPKPKARARVWLASAITVTTAVAGITMWIARHPAAENRPIQIRQLTTNSAENPVWQAVISPDGNYIAYGDLNGIKIRLISTGESHLLPRPPSLAQGATWLPAAWYPDGARIIATSEGSLLAPGLFQ